MKLRVSGFSLIELMVVIVIIALMTTQIPRLTRIHYTNQEKFVAQLNALALNAYSHALITGSMVQLFFDTASNPKTIGIKQAVEGAQEATFDWVSSDYGQNSMLWDDNIILEQCIIDGKDETYGGDLKTFWIYIMPDGTVQQATIRLKDEKSGKVFTVELNPFSVHFRVI